MQDSFEKLARLAGRAIELTRHKKPSRAVRAMAHDINMASMDYLTSREIVRWARARHDRQALLSGTAPLGIEETRAQVRQAQAAYHAAARKFWVMLLGLRRVIRKAYGKTSQEYRSLKLRSLHESDADDGTAPGEQLQPAKAA